jgi:two-component system, NarL family, nitrate/nitrite response regulator NarL
LEQENSTAIEVFLASTQTIFRAGLRQLLNREPDLTVVGEAGNAAEALALVEKTNPDVVLLDWPLRGLPRMRDLGGLKTLFNAVPTLLLSADVGNINAAEALLEGAGGLMFKNSSADMLIKGIRNIAQGQYWIGNEAMTDLLTALNRAAERSQLEAPKKTFGLTPRELEVIQKIVSGYSNKDIAGKLSITDDTVKHHLSNIFNKLGVFNRLELALFAIHHGLIGLVRAKTESDEP